MSHRDLAKDRPKVRGHREVAPFEKHIAVEPGKLPMDLPTIHPRTQDKQAGAMSVIRSPGAVFRDGPAKLGHRQQHDILLPGAQVLPKGRNGLSQVLGSPCEGSVCCSLPHMGIPSPRFRKSDLQAYVGPNHRGDLPERLSERGRGVAPSAHPVFPGYRLKQTGGLESLARSPP
jgi:hypothetical protein